MTSTPGNRQHIVPQQMIRNFTGNDGKLVEMLKPELVIGTRRRSPKSILFRDNFYRDRVGDFDAALLTPVEQKFARVYPEVLAGATLNGEQGAAFVCWVAAMLVRTQLVTALMPGGDAGQKTPLVGALDELKQLLDNLARTQWYDMYCDLFVRRGWSWKRYQLGSSEPDLVLTDHPVCMTSIHQEGGQAVIVPLSRRIVLVGGAPQALELMRGAGIQSFNFFLLGWARRHIFAAQRSSLEFAASLLSDHSPFPPASVEAGRSPLFGLPERLRERMKHEPEPRGFDFGRALRCHAENFGPPRWENQEEAGPSSPEQGSESWSGTDS